MAWRKRTTLSNLAPVLRIGLEARGSRHELEIVCELIEGTFLIQAENIPWRVSMSVVFSRSVRLDLCDL
jgi:hypothetical protein